MDMVGKIRFHIKARIYAHNSDLERNLKIIADDMSDPDLGNYLLGKVADASKNRDMIDELVELDKYIEIIEADK